MSTDVEVGEVVDARELMRPMPVLATTKAMRRLAPGQVLKVLATDRGALSDMGRGHRQRTASSGTDGDTLVFVIRKTEES
jgi:TusA-related sulfurtransferase